MSVVICYCLTSLGYLMGHSMLNYALPLAFAISAIVAYFITTPRRWGLSLLISILVWAVSIGLCTYFVDSSCDGNHYHQEQVTLLFNGWNPFLDPLGPDVSAVWVNHYAIGIETVGAAIMKLTDNLQSSKAVTLVLAVATVFLACGLFAQVYPGMKRRQCMVSALLIVCNPIIICQLLRAYIDGLSPQFIALTALIAVSIVVRGNSNWVNWLLLALIIIMSVAIKFNAFFLEVVTGACLFIGFWIYGYLRKSLRLFAVALAVGILAFCVFSYFPYIVNWQLNGHPLYPLMGEGSIDISMFPDGYEERNRFVNFVASLYTFGRPSLDTMAGGFLPMMMLMFPLSIAVAVVVCRKSHKFVPEVYAMVCIIVSCFIFKTAHSPRYIPQLWLIVPIAYILCVNYGMTWLRRSFALMGLLTGAICAVTTPLGAYRFTLHRNATLDVLRGKEVGLSLPHPQWVRTLEENDISYYYVPLDSIPLKNRESLAEYARNLDGKEEHDFGALYVSDEDMAAIQQRLKERNFYKVGVKIRSLLGKNDSIPLYLSPSTLED